MRPLIDRHNVPLALVAGAVILLALVGVYAIYDAVSAGPGRRPAETWEIPGGFKGLITARFGVAECPPVPRRDGKLVHAVTPDGSFCTSDLLREGAAVDTYEYVFADGRRVPLRYGEEVAKLVVRGRVEPDPAADLFLFVGSPDEQRRAHDNLPRN